MKIPNHSAPDQPQQPQQNHTASITSETRSQANKMKAIAQSEYGSVEVLNLEEVDKPIPLEHDVLVKIHAASVHAGDWHLMRGTPFIIRLMFGGLFKPKYPILGCSMAGSIEAIGKNITQFKPGDEVFGDLSESGFGAFAEYACAPESALALKPTNLSFEESATVPTSALAALQAIRDMGQLHAGLTVLIQGASGGVGSFAIQIAKALGAEVTASCSPRKIEMVRSLGADHIIDYTQEDVTQNGKQYDLILDAAAYRSVFDFLPVLAPEGTYVMIGGSTPRFFQVMLLSPWISKLHHRNVKCLASTPNAEDLRTLKTLIETGKMTPFIDHLGLD